MPDVRFVAAYQGLTTKWIASRALLWQFPALTLTAQAFLISAATQPTESPIVVDILLSFAILSIGIASILIQFKIGRESHLDLVMLDRYERILLADNPTLALNHSAPLRDREALLMRDFSDSEMTTYLWRFRKRGRWPSLNVRISLTWATMQLIVSGVGATIGLIA